MKRVRVQSHPRIDGVISFGPNACLVYNVRTGDNSRRQGMALARLPTIGQVARSP